MKLATVLMFLGLVVSLVSTACFGWNAFPGSHAEMVFDAISLSLWMYGAGRYHGWVLRSRVENPGSTRAI